MEHRQDGGLVIEQHLSVGVLHGGAELFLVGVGVIAPVAPGTFLVQPGLAAGVVRADVRRFVAGAGLELVAGVGPGGHRLGLQSLFGEGGGHLRPEDPQKIGPQVHFHHGLPVQDL